MIDDDLLERLRHKGEGADLDFKQAQYAFVGATDHQKSELLKDILAMANAYRDGPGYILVGLKDQAPQPAEVVGIATTNHIDDATLQQFVHSKVDPRLEFRYEERLFHGKHVAVIEIPRQPRPFVPVKNYGKLEKNVGYVRRGSSTGEASMSEMRMMALADVGASKQPQIDLHIENEKNAPLSDAIELSFLEFAELPDYEESNTLDMGNGRLISMPSIRMVNRHFYRDGAEYHATMKRVIEVRLSLVNRSSFSLDEVKLEVTCVAPEGQIVEMMRSDHLPDEPEPSSLNHLMGARTLVESLQEKMKVDERGHEPLCHIPLGTLRPGETGRAEADLAVLPGGPGNYTLRIRILAKELSAPIVKEHTIEVTGQVEQVALAGLERLLYAKYLRKDEG